MSPEQARGKTVDKRADIWAFGVVLYELLAGRMLFGGGETVTDSLAAVLTREPDWNALPAATPPRVRRLLDRCLRKDPKARLRDIGEARFILDETEPEPAPVAARAWLPWAMAVVFSPGADSPLMRVPAAGGLPTPVTSLEAGERAHIWPQFLPDGRHVLYLAWAADPDKSKIYVQELGSGTRVMVTKSALRAAWAAPGYLLFVREGTLFAQRMEPKTFQLEGEPFSLAQNVTNYEGNGRAAFAVSQNGVLVCRGGLLSRIRQLTWFDQQGKRLAVLGQPGDYASMALSPDEKNAALVAGPSEETTCGWWIFPAAFSGK